MHWSEIKTWPNHALSRRIDGPVHRWHVQETGNGPLILLLHGAGGSTHSWRGVIPLLASDFRVLALDLPGHGFTQLGGRQRSGLQAMATDIVALAQQEGWQPDVLVGHSAGGAVALELSRRMRTGTGEAPKVIGVNAALETFPGLAGILFPAMAKMLAIMPFSAAMFSGVSTKPTRVEALIASTGSKIDVEGIALYRRLVADRAHVDGTLQMMAQWSLQPLLAELPRIDTKTTLLAAERDTTVPPHVSHQAARVMPNARVVDIEGLGHLAPEEDPTRLTSFITDAMLDASPVAGADT